MDCSKTSYIYLDHVIIFAPNLVGLIVSYCIIIFVGVTNVTGCYWVTPPSPDGSHAAKFLQDNML